KFTLIYYNNTDKIKNENSAKKKRPIDSTFPALPKPKVCYTRDNLLNKEEVSCQEAD
ncbi:unnamed protein product, partial [Leptidea sinapis]